MPFRFSLQELLDYRRRREEVRQREMSEAQNQLDHVSGLLSQAREHRHHYAGELNQVAARGLGFAPNRGTLVLIDGRPEIAGLFGHPLPDTYRKAGIYSAALVKGGASTLYGSNAIAGVLDMTSFYRPDLDRYTNLELNGGSFDGPGFVRLNFACPRSRLQEALKRMKTLVTAGAKE